MGRKLLKTVQTITTFRNPLADPVRTRRGPPLVRGPQFENRWLTAPSNCSEQWRRQGGRGSFPPYGLTSKNYVICVCFHCH